MKPRANHGTRSRWRRRFLPLPQGAASLTAVVGQRRRAQSGEDVCAESSLSSCREQLTTARPRPKEESESRRAPTAHADGENEICHHRHKALPKSQCFPANAIAPNVAGAYVRKPVSRRAEGTSSPLLVDHRKSREAEGQPRCAQSVEAPLFTASERRCQTHGNRRPTS